VISSRSPGWMPHELRAGHGPIRQWLTGYSQTWRLLSVEFNLLKYTIIPFHIQSQKPVLLFDPNVIRKQFPCLDRPEEIIFGNNMTTPTLHISRWLARNLQAGDNILVTRLDHDANISPGC